MQFTITTLLSLASVLQAASITTYPNTGCGSNPANWFADWWICDNLPAGTCCQFHQQAASAHWELPNSSRGYASDTNICVKGPWNPVYGPRDDSECFDYVNPSINSAWWVNGFAKTKRDDPVPNGDCAAPNIVSYANGTARVSLKVPEGQIETVKVWVEAKDFEKLSTLESA